MMQHDTPTDLMKCLNRKHEHHSVEIRRQHALEIIRSGGDIHSVTEHYNKTCLHLAIENSFADVIQLLLEKGIDVNAQTYMGDTALHLTSYTGVQTERELVPMLLYYGADPWIRNNSNAAPLDYYLRSKRQLVATIEVIEHLYYYMFDRYTDTGLSVNALLRMADLQLSNFQEIVRTIKQVDLDNLAMTGFVDIELILTMPSENLRLLLDKFHYVFVALFRWGNVNLNSRWSNMFRFENIYILVESDLQRDFMDWLSKWKQHHKCLSALFKNPARRQEIVYYLLSYGMEIHEGDVDTLYKYRGCNRLFKLLRFMDVKTDCSYEMKRLIPRLVFQVTGDIQKSIEDPQFWIEYLTDLNFEPVLPYYAVPNLQDLFCEVNVAGKEKFFKKLRDQPRIPLLMEMARNVFRKYFVQRLGITNAKQFYLSLELLPISSHHRKIITLETELY